jgi:single-strand DNA-binding protein
MNVVTLIGNLASEVELREVAPDRRVASFRLAVDRAGGEGTDFIGIAVWNRQAELCAQYLEKGRRVAIDGRIRTREWEDEGQKRYGFEVVARRVEFLSGGPRHDERSAGADVIPFETAAAG